MPDGQPLRIDNIDPPFDDTDLKGKRYLYHYTRAEVALGHILRDERLRLSPYSDLNDPKEAKDWIMTVGAATDGGATAGRIWCEMSERIKGRTRLLCFTSDGYGLKREPQDIDDFWEARGFARPTMWAHYAENHRGIALVFDRRKLLANAIAELKAKGQLHYGHVSYRMLDEADGWSAFSFNSADWESLPAYQGVLRHLEQHRRWLFFTKHPDWASEQKCRIVGFGDFERHEFISTKSALVEIIFGDRASAATANRCYEFGAKLGVIVSKVDWHNGRPYRMIQQHAPKMVANGPP
ncbi:MAG TPA: DUF2971 domain-containing protein [Terriglobales bacterium]|nr:DUF2971 domain-containing protein [Terriglobales bacterium]